MGAAKTDIDAVYKDAFGVDFAKQTAEQRKLADKVVAALHTYRHVRTPEQEKLLSTIDTRDPQVLQGLGIYASYRAGSVPDEMGGLSDLVRNKAIAAGVPVEKLEQIAGDRQAQFKQWGSGVINRFAHLAPPLDDATKGEAATMKVPDKPKPVDVQPMTNPLPVMQPIAQPPAVLAAPGVQGAAPPMPPPSLAADPTQQQVPPEYANDPRLVGATGPAGVM